VSGEGSADGATSMINLGSTLMALHDKEAKAEAGPQTLLLFLLLLTGLITG